MSGVHKLGGNNTSMLICLFQWLDGGYLEECSHSYDSPKYWGTRSTTYFQGVWGEIAKCYTCKSSVSLRVFRSEKKPTNKPHNYYRKYTLKNKIKENLKI